MDDFAKQGKDDLTELDKATDDLDAQAAIDDFAANLEHDVNMLDAQSDDGGFRDALLDFEEQLEIDYNNLDDAYNDLDMQDVIDDFEADLEHDVNMLDEGVDDYFMDKAIDDFKKQTEEDLMDGQPKKERPNKSCNAIAKTSTCIDYIGSFWTETQMKYACEYSGTLSPEPCETGSIGGCNVGQGSFNDMIIWMYSRGGASIVASSAKSAKPACDMNPMGTWLNAR